MRPAAPANEKMSVSVAFASFELNGARFEDPHTIEPDVLHDLKIVAHLSRWPDDANELVLEPLSVEPDVTYEVPTFTFSRSSSTPPHFLSATSRLLIKHPVALLAR